MVKVAVMKSDDFLKLDIESQLKVKSLLSKTFYFQREKLFNDPEEYFNNNENLNSM